MDYPKIKASSTYRMQTQDGKSFFLGQFILETVNKYGAVNPAKFVAEINHEMVYMNVKLDPTYFGGESFDSEGFFYSYLDANINNEVFNKATFTKAGNITSPEWTLTLG